ncbi:M20/M25/M40 family metallo-hydrolase [Demetria terragena]|uniref:M20/M25/M40 family metallo-hydrolase n=1 Tax=Demetria terragena TaxID=63959 RepID=UPI00036A28D3|nr:M20/M25/M40 family metallo-hydrolase [Demetria terragena]
MRSRHRLSAAIAAVAFLGVPLSSADARSASSDIDLGAMQGHLKALQQISDEHGGRGTGTTGYQKSVDYVKGKLQGAGYQVTVQPFDTQLGTSYNVIAEMPGTSPGPVVMVGGHLDSADNAGINDNGSGTAGVLETALAFAKSGEKPRNTLRFAFWGAEELNLVGSTHYAEGLGTQGRDRIQAYLNVDMIASKNAAYFVYDDNPAGNFIRDDLTKYFTSAGVQSEYTDPNGRSDHAALRRYGIPTGGIFTGAEQIKTSAQAQKWGGTAGKPYDSCYHQACDDMTNINTTALDRHADAIGHLLWSYADKDFGSANTR